MADTVAVSNEQLFAQMKAVEKKINRLQRQQNASDKANGIVPEKSKNNGFNKAEAMSPELCGFLNLSSGSELPRPEVTKRISSYVKENGLQDGKKINLDSNLMSLLGVDANTEVTYFTLQKYLKNHFIKKDAAAATSATPAAPPVTAPVAAKPKAPKRSRKA